jgi:osmotically-inducible protein OsmY
MSDLTLHGAVMTALADNSLLHADEIVAEVRDGNVVLRGTAGTPIQRAEAARTARAVPGVRSVDDQLEVRPTLSHRRDEADTEAAVLDALIADDELPAGGIDVKVDEHTVTLTGTVERPDLRDRAESVARGVGGVEHVHNELRVSAGDAAQRSTLD